MREIKFRAWDKLNKETTLFGLFERPTATYGKNCEIMQFTGLKDKNGKEIYEGDVVKILGEPKYATVWEIVFQRGAFKFADRGGGGFRYMDSETYKTECEVIGNIYENPELLDSHKGK